MWSFWLVAIFPAAVVEGGALSLPTKEMGEV
eukprot:COSAG02_NODE_32469_length_515_cov_1.975962_1_plen_30_part_10